MKTKKRINPINQQTNIPLKGPKVIIAGQFCSGSGRFLVEPDVRNLSDLVVIGSRIIEIATFGRLSGISIFVNIYVIRRPG